MRLLLVGLLLGVTACNNFDGLVERCVAEGRCGETSNGGGGGGGGGQSAPNATLRLSRTTISFGQVVELEEKTEALTITNDGPDTVSSIAATVVGSGLSNFSATTTCGSPLAKDASCTVTVKFAPQAPGTLTATLEVQPLELSRLDVALDGEGIAGLEISPQPVSFPDTNSGSTSSLSLSITNRTSSLLSPTYVFNPVSVFTRSGCDQISGGQSCTFNVQFAPLDAGYFQSSLIASAAAGANNWSTPPVLIDGVGISRGALGLSPDPIGGSTDAGSTRDFTFTLSNGSPTTIGPISVAISQTGSVYSLVDAGCTSLDAGASCTGVLRFQPPGIAVYPAQLVADAGLGGIALSQINAAGAGTFPVHVTASPVDAGAILRTDAGFSCASDCTFDVFVVPPNYPAVRLDALGTAQHYALKTWTGDCADAGFNSTCTQTVSGPLTLGATFERANVAFVTSAVFNGDLGGLSGADSKCMQAAASAGLPGTFRAWLSTSAAARNRLPDAGGWIRTDGLPFAKDKASLLAGAVIYPLDRDQNGTAITGNTVVWTGARADGTPDPTYRCGDWASTTGLGSQGSTGHGTGGWTNILGAFNCATTAHLYCFQVDSRAPATEPSCAGASSFLFVSEPRDPVGAVTGPAVLDGYCQAEASDAGYPGSYVAWINASGAATARLSATLSGPVYRPDCALLTPSYAALRTSRVDFSSAPNVGTQKTYVTDYVAVGSGNPTIDDSNSNNCQGWTTWSSNPPQMVSGQPVATSASSYWGSSTSGCFYGGTSLLRTYCVRSQ